MKKTLIVLVLGALLFVGCSDRVADPSGLSAAVSEPSESKKPSGSFEDTFFVTGFDRMTPEELASGYTHVIYYNERAMEGVMNSPAALFIDTMKDTGLLSYDKLTGVFADACRDPLCVHESCLWSATENRIYHGTEGLFFLVDEEEQTALYHTDFAGANVKKIYESGNMLSYVVQEGAYVYLLEEALDEETDTAVSRIMRLPSDGGEPIVLLEQARLYYYMPMGGNILYLDPEKGHMLYDADTKQTQAFGQADMLPIALCGENFYYESDGSLYRRADYGTEDAVLLTADVSAVEWIFDNGWIYFHDGKTVYCTNEDFSDIDEVYTAKTNERISNVIVDDNLLFYRYSVGMGSSRKHYFVFADLQTGKTLEVVND